jgi:hypothetical protein
MFRVGQAGGQLGLGWAWRIDCAEVGRSMLRPYYGAKICGALYGAAEIHHRTRAMMRQPELLPRTTAWYSRFSDSRISNLG